MKTVKVNQRVAYTQAVISRCGYSKHLADMRGTVTDVICDGKLAVVDTHGTYPDDQGNSVRCIPVFNLTPILDNGAIFGD